MRFVIDKLTKSGRACHIELDKLQFETPLLLMYTRSASIPHISKEVFDDCFPHSNEIFLVSAANTFLMQKSCSAFGKGVMEFAGYKDAASFLMVKDAGQVNGEGYKEPDAVGIFTRSGKTVVNSEKYMDLVNALRPSAYELLCDGETDLECSRKRAMKAVDRTQNFYDECLKFTKNPGIVIAAVEGGYNTDERKRMLSFLNEHENEFQAVSIDGLHLNGISASQLEYSAMQPIVDQCVKALPETKLRIMYGGYNPLNILHLVRSGIDCFDSSYPYLATQARYALTFSVDSTGDGFALNLNDEKFKEDFSPLRKECTCLTCTKYTRAYVYHLVNCKELLAATLLMIHNLHHYKEFFKAIRKAVNEEKLDVLIEKMEKEYTHLQLELPKDDKKKEKGRFSDD